MKTMITKTLRVALMFVTVMGMANESKNTVKPKINEVEKGIINVEKAPVFKKEGDKLFMNLLNLDQDNVTIKIIDSAGRVVFLETIKGKLVIEKAFNFENAYQNEYTVIVVDNKEVFKETVEVK
ncbi:MAG: hypothetical protein AAGF77_12795 [Bacteroidota bacterium]